MTNRPKPRYANPGDEGQRLAFRPQRARDCEQPGSQTLGDPSEPIEEQGGTRGLCVNTGMFSDPVAAIHIFPTLHDLGLDPDRRACRGRL